MSFHRDVWSPYSERQLLFYVAHEGPEEVRVGESRMALDPLLGQRIKGHPVGSRPHCATRWEHSFFATFQ